MSLEDEPAAGLAASADVTVDHHTTDAAQLLSSGLFEAAPIAAVVLDLDGRHELVNDAFCALVGQSRERLLGMPHALVSHPDGVAADADALRAVIEGESPTQRRKKRYLHASGSVVWAQIDVALLRDGEDRPLRFVLQVTDITTRRAYEHALQRLADHDPLTDLSNRRSLVRELRRHTTRARRYGATGALLMLDLDHFKYFNDTRGHGAGDEVIVRVAQALRTRLRESDVVARLGGDEFAVLLPGGDEREATVVAQSILELVREEALPTYDEALPALIGGGRRMTVSIGIARFDDREGLGAEEMLDNADRAMYDAKRAGGDAWMRYDPSRHARKGGKSASGSGEEIAHAIDHNGLVLLAQPVIALAGDRSTQYELLLRMRDRRGDLLEPASFLYTAERLGLAGQIDRWVTARGIDTLVEQRALGRDLRLEVNLSGHTIGDDALLELIGRRLRETGIPPDRLIFEVAETAAVAQIAHSAAFARHLSELGCKLALDDFGAGFGSFYYLKHLPSDYLKIDREFVSQCARNSTNRTMIGAIVHIAREMGKQTIAECADDQETVDVLTDLGVDYAQGFHLGRPAPLAEYLAAEDRGSP